MVPMRHVGGGGIIEVAGMGMESVFPVPGHCKKMDTVGFHINAFPEVFGHMASLLAGL